MSRDQDLPELAALPRIVVRLPIAHQRNDPADAAASDSARSSAGPMGWWYVFGSRINSRSVDGADTDGHRLGGLVYVPAADKAYDSLLFPELRGTAGLVPACACIITPGLAWWCWSGSYDTSVPAWRVQVSPQVDLACRRRPVALCPWACSSPVRSCANGMPDAYWGLAVGGSMAGPSAGSSVPSSSQVDAGQCHDWWRCLEPLLRGCMYS